MVAIPSVTRTPMTRNRTAIWLLGIAIVLTILQYSGVLPAWLHRIPDAMIPPAAIWLDAFFNFVKDDLGLLKFTRFLTAGLENVLDTSGNIFYGKRRWPNLGPIPWTAIAGVAVVVGYYLGGWRLDRADWPMENRNGNHVGSRRRSTARICDRPVTWHRSLEICVGR